MNSLEKEIESPRATKIVMIDRGKPNTADYLCKEYELPDPYTLHQYLEAWDDLKKCWENGERTPQEGGLE